PGDTRGPIFTVPSYLSGRAGDGFRPPDRFSVRPARRIRIPQHAPVPAMERRGHAIGQPVHRLALGRHAPFPLAIVRYLGLPRAVQLSRGLYPAGTSLDARRMA